MKWILLSCCFTLKVLYSSEGRYSFKTSAVDDKKNAAGQKETSMRCSYKLHIVCWSKF